MDFFCRLTKINFFYKRGTTVECGTDRELSVFYRKRFGTKVLFVRGKRILRGLYDGERNHFLKPFLCSTASNQIKPSGI